MEVKFSPEYFGIDEDSASLFPNAKFENGQYCVQCNLGDCGMTAASTADGDINFSLELSQDSANAIHVGDLELYNSARSASLSASCVYDSTVSVSSQDYDVVSAVADGELSANGDLTSAFSLNLFSDQSRNTAIDGLAYIGARVWADIEWSADQDLVKFYVSDCSVNLGGARAVSAQIIKDNCYSNALGVTKTGPVHEYLQSKKAGFTFNSFSSDASAQSQEVKVTCDVKLCVNGEDNCAIQSETCADADAEGYNYTPTGCAEHVNVEQPDESGECVDWINDFPNHGLPEMTYDSELVDENLLHAPENLKRTGFCIDENGQATLTLSDGTVFIGQDRDGIVDFRGVPYAIPPLEQMRWTQPLVKLNFEGQTYDFTDFGDACAQHHHADGTSEDCLNINISVPRDALEEGRLVPIIYVVHGGGFNHGNNRWRSPDLIKKEQVAIFNIGYRFGIFGFYTLPEIEQGQNFQTNWGLQDPVAAMAFSQTYGPIFGGDPDNASFSARSSGAEIVWRLLTVPCAWPYFKRVNMMNMGLNTEYPLDHAPKLRDVVYGELNCSDTPCMRAQEHDDLAHAGDAAAYGARHPTKITLEPGFGMVVDGRFGRQQLMFDVRDGNVRPHTPIAWSYSEHDNWAFNHLAFANSMYKFMTDKLGDIAAAKAATGHKVPYPYANQLIERFYANYDDISPIEENFFCPDNGEDCNDIFSKWVNSMNWVCNTRWGLKGALSNPEEFPELGPLYVTQFSAKNCDPDPVTGDYRKTCHTGEGPFVYGDYNLKVIDDNLGRLYYDMSAKESVWLVDRMRSAWGNYFRTGEFPAGTIEKWSDIEDEEHETYNVISPANGYEWATEKTYVDECRALDQFHYDDCVENDYIVATSQGGPALDKDNVADGFQITGASKGQFGGSEEAEGELAALEAKKALEAAKAAAKAVLAASLLEAEEAVEEVVEEEKTYFDNINADLPASDFELKSFSCNGETCDVETNLGVTFTCLDRDDVVDCRGIRYAEAPEGALRWKSPVLIKYENEAVDATEWGNMCACHRCYGVQQEISQEDCLTVNIAVKKEALANSEGVPLVYYLHGGGGNHGFNRYDAYDMVVEQNVMVVSVAYRLGMFAYLLLPELEEGQKYRSNFGLQDQQGAMKWAQKYAPIFGGNPAEAVLSGSSSAGEAVWWHTVLEESWPFYNKVNVMCMGVNNAVSTQVGEDTTKLVLKFQGCDTIDCLRQYSREEIRDAANQAAGTARHASSKITLEPGFAPVIDGKMIVDDLFTLVSSKKIKKHTPISWSYNDHDQWEFNHLSFFTHKNKFLWKEVDAVNAANAAGFVAPSNFTDRILEEIFGPEADGVKEVFGCADNGETKECNVQYDRFLTSYGWTCNTRAALDALRGDDDFGPIYMTQFNARNCAPDPETGVFTKTCHCTEAHFMYNQNFVVPRLEGQYTDDQKKTDDWLATEEIQNLKSVMRSTFGQFFRDGTFPEGTVQEFNAGERTVVNTIDESAVFNFEATFVDECAALDKAFDGQYLERTWRQLGVNWHYWDAKPVQAVCEA